MLSLQDLTSLVDERNVQLINRYFAGTESSNEQPTLNITERIKIDFKTFYLQKSIVISEHKVDGFYTDFLILQEPSWKTLLRFTRCILSTFELMKEYASSSNTSFKIIHDYTKGNTEKNVHLLDDGTLENHVRYVINNYFPSSQELSSINSKNKIAFKIYNDVQCYCADRIIEKLLSLFKL